MKKINFFKTTFAGLMIGGSMLLPGVSGGTMAILLGVYDKLLSAVSNLLSDFKKNILYLSLIALGGGIGVLLFSKLVLKVINLFEFQMMFFFMGAIIGTVPRLAKKGTSNEPINIKDTLFLLLGFSLCVMFGKLPQISENIVNENIFGFIFLNLIGVILAVALVLPGISFSYTLLIFGIYEKFLEALSNIELFFLLSIGSGIVIGTFLTAKILTKLIEKHEHTSYMVISGFVIGSILEIFPGIPSGYNIAVCTSFLVIGFILTYLLGAKKVSN